MVFGAQNVVILKVPISRIQKCGTKMTEANAVWDSKVSFWGPKVFIYQVMRTIHGNPMQ